MRSTKEKTADCLIIGGGVIGLAVARELAECGLQKVTVIERAALGAESSHAAAGMLAPQAEADCADDFFRLACAGRDLYPLFSERLREETGIDIELDPTGTLYVALTSADEEEIEHRFRWQQTGGLAVEKMTAADALLFEPHLSPYVRSALRFPNDTQVEPRRLVTALAASAHARGVQLLVGSEVTSIIIDNRRVCGVETAQEGPIFAGKVVIASGAWTSHLLRGTLESHNALPPSVTPVRGQMLCFDARPPIIRHVVYSPRGYLVPRRDGRLLAGSTTEHVGFHKAVTGSGLHSITTHAAELAPSIGRLPVVDSWAGLRPGTFDNYPLIGESSAIENLYFATGHYRNGILLAPITAQLITGMVTRGERSPLLKAFAPDRLSNTEVAQMLQRT
ncbi:MAG: glycine oxidase ThiO [Pyrinomonadaceae bacterium]